MFEVHRASCWASEQEKFPQNFLLSQAYAMMRSIKRALVPVLVLSALFVGWIYGHTNSRQLPRSFQALIPRSHSPCWGRVRELAQAHALTAPEPTPSALSSRHQPSSLSRAFAGMCSFTAAQRKDSTSNVDYQRCFESPRDTWNRSRRGAASLGRAHQAFRSRVASMRYRLHMFANCVSECTCAHVV